MCVLTWYTYITAAGLFQCFLMGMMNDEARMRLESIHCNGHHKLTFESWVGTILGQSLPTVLPKIVCFDLVHLHHSRWTVPMSPYGYDE
eukprot:scaffold29140_cov50-Cyclotella_meneghiniana.AAC.2